jgi:hypothetical protein
MLGPILGQASLAAEGGITMTALSLRRFWTIYKRTVLGRGTCGKRDLAISQVAFYSGARGVVKVLDHMMPSRGCVLERVGTDYRAPDRPAYGSCALSPAEFSLRTKAGNGAGGSCSVCC